MTDLFSRVSKRQEDTETEVSVDKKENGKRKTESKVLKETTNKSKSSSSSSNNKGSKRKRELLIETSDKDNIEEDIIKPEQKMRKSKRAKVDQEN